MSYGPGNTFSIPLLTRNTTSGQPANADATPLAKLWREGAVTAEVVTVTANGVVGDYDMSGTIPVAWVNGDRVSLKATWTSDAVNDGVSFSLGRLDAAVSSRSTFAGGAVASVTGSVGSVVGYVAPDNASVATLIKLAQAKR